VKKKPIQIERRIIFAPATELRGREGKKKKEEEREDKENEENGKDFH